MTNAIRLCCTYILSENVPMNTNRRFAGLFSVVLYSAKSLRIFLRDPQRDPKKSGENLDIRLECPE